jgi:3-oxoadipate enol-lactonase
MIVLREIGMILGGAGNTVRDMETMVTVGTDKVWAEDSGGSGPVVVLLHEGVGDSTMWDPIWPELTAQCRVIRYDVQAYHKSPPATEKYTLLGDLRAVLDHFGLPKIHLVGCSMGGGTAIEFALAAPSRVESLTLLCPGIEGYAWPEEPELDAEFEAIGDNEDGLVDLCLRVWGAAGATEFVTELARSAIRAEHNQDRYMQEGEPTFDRLGEITTPTTIMVGDKDRAALIDSNEQAAELIPGCKLIRMPGVDHYPTAREPKLVAETILAQVSA